MIVLSVGFRGAGGANFRGRYTHVFLVLGMFTWRTQSQHNNIASSTGIVDRTILAVLTSCLLQRSLGGEVRWIDGQEGQSVDDKVLGENSGRWVFVRLHRHAGQPHQRTDQWTATY